VRERVEGISNSVGIEITEILKFLTPYQDL